MIIFLYGEDSFRSHQKLLEIKNKYLASDESGSGLSVFDCGEEKDIFRKIKNILGTANLLAPKRLLIVKNIISEAGDLEQKNLLEFLKKNGQKIGEDRDIVAVFWENNLPKKSGALFKFLEKNGKSQNFEKLTSAKLNNWILKNILALDSNAKISKLALDKLAAFCGGDTALLYSEIQKLVNYSDKNTIGEKEVELLVKANLDNNIFQMVDAIGANNKKEALKLLHNHLQSGDDPFYLFSMFLYQFRNLLKIADLKENGVSSEYEISKITKTHPFVIRKSLAQIRNFSFEKLKSIYQELGEIDGKIKIGKIEIKLALDKFVAEM